MSFIYLDLEVIIKSQDGSGGKVFGYALDGQVLIPSHWQAGDYSSHFDIQNSSGTLSAFFKTSIRIFLIEYVDSFIYILIEFSWPVKG